MKLKRYLLREIQLTKEAANPNVISLRFVQLFEQDSRSIAEEEEYQMLYALMRTRWRWYMACQDALSKKLPGKESM